MGNRKVYYLVQNTVPLNPTTLRMNRTQTGAKECFNPLNAELNPIYHLVALLGVHHFLHVSRMRVKSLTLRLLMSYIYIYICIYIYIYIYDISSLRVKLRFSDIRYLTPPYFSRGLFSSRLLTKSEYPFIHSLCILHVPSILHFILLAL